ncbi:hypothetical protein [Wolbachia endosymbiont of Aedes albopictus]|uniref:hypothetical protein n=1 Tax=Wolbachia endosymbiont of Aedes albopictus TaxID=167957 RepID=UPI000BBCD2EA|nr:hypothetical protein [Wolbachia endosymbiont of Aedes albopictus]UVW84072.1 hypothetical protein NHG98_00955 [Wolbachia endosymbiont of Aedes albopictus]
MVKEIFSNWLGVTKNTADIANNAAIDAAQATDIANNTAINVAQSADIANNTAINVAQSADIANLAAENASQAEKITNLSEAVADQQKIMIACIAVSVVAAIAITSFVAFCIYKGVKLEREKEKNLSKDTPGTELNNLGKSNTSGTKLDADGGTKLSNLEVNGSKSVNNIAA